MRSILLRSLAVAVTVIAVGMSVKSGIVRGGAEPVAEILVVSISIAFCVAGQLLLAFFKSRGAVILWIFCTAVTIFGHLNFWEYAATAAAKSRARHSVAMQGLNAQIALIKQTIGGSHSRSVAEVVRDLEVERGWAKRVALKAELAEARRVESLQAKLIQLSTKAQVTEVTASTDLVISGIARLLNLDPQTLALLIGTGLGTLLELLGAFLWHHILSDEEMHASSFPPLGFEVGRLDAVKGAIESGEIRLNVREIRQWLGCGQSEAALIRRLLAERPGEW